MINENEIKVVNWVNHSAVWSERNDKVPFKKFNFQWTVADWYLISECLLSLESIEPIPITEEILEKMGFDKGFRRYSYHTHVHIEKYTTTSQGWINNAWSVLMISSVPYHLGRQFKYVH